MNRAHRIMEMILEDPRGVDVGLLANELLTEFHRGYPIKHLRRLLSSPDPQVVKTGVFITSELGDKAAALLGDVVSLLKHPEKWVRADAIDSVLVCAAPGNKTELASVVELLEDAEAGVRWKTMGFLSRASNEQLQGALSYLLATKPESPHVAGLQLLIADGGNRPEQLRRFLQSENALHRKYGAVAAARVPTPNVDALLYASSLDDTDVNQFSADILKMRRIKGSG